MFVKERFAYAHWVWGMDSKEQFEKACSDLSSLGYKAMETVCGFCDIFSSSSEMLEVCKKYDIKPFSFYFFMSDNAEKDLENLKRYIPFIKAVGGENVTFQALWGKNGADNSDLDFYVKSLTALSDICAENGLTASLHPHWNTPIGYINEIDYIMRNTDPTKLTLCVDTAHIVACKMLPEMFFKKYSRRITATHLKDMWGMLPDGKLAEYENPCSRFCPLGRGSIEFSDLFRILEGSGYKGYYCCEVDGGDHAENAKRCFKYLSDRISYGYDC